MHFYESSIITTKDGLHCQVYGNEHPMSSILVKPKYIPTGKIESDALQYRFISGRKMNRLNLWIDKAKLKTYIEQFKEAYPHYMLESPQHTEERLFFTVPVDDIERIYFPRRGLSELMAMPKEALDEHLKTVHELVSFFIGSGLRIKDLGITYSTLMGHYMSNISDINIVVYGKENFWKLMKYLETAEHPSLKWKTDEEWLDFYKKRNRFGIFSEDGFLRIMRKRKSEGYFNGCLFVIFATEKEEEVWFKWGEEQYSSLGLAAIEGIVTDSHNSIVRPGCYDIKDAKVIDGNGLKLEGINNKIKKIVFYSRDYAMLAHPGEKLRACGILEKVSAKNKENYYRLVVGYFDAYVDERREKEFIKPVENE
ncbi:hypothetical protein CMO89_04370 [Candidatus Woesearchaeota archaeon]|nr:hypothetical protein [Candidatus Woesearchaeota archaeon]|tara:strand:- start:16904 stop:18004 length:1101 start_codon:yes stop_codon:yes gene_type:complete